MDIEKIRLKLYAESPHEVGSKADNYWRDGVDAALYEIMLLTQTGEL